MPPGSSMTNLTSRYPTPPLNSNNTLYTSNKDDTPPNLKFYPKTKFEKKVVVWLAIGPNGWSKPLIKESFFAINGKVYLEECTKKRLIPYIGANYDDNCLFWPDKDNANYAKVVVEHLEQEGMHFVTKEENPSNPSEERCIEVFLALLKARVYANDWRAETQAS